MLVVIEHLKFANNFKVYFMYHPKLRKIIIVGFICLKTTQKAPSRYMEQARRNIVKYLEQEANNG